MSAEDRAARLAALQARVVEVRRQYVRRVAAQLADFAEAMAAPPDGTADLLREIRDEAHRIHGTAGTVGLAEIGEVAAALEALLGEAVVRNATDVGDAVWDETARLVAELRRRLEAAEQMDG